MHNSMVVFTFFFILEWKYRFRANSVQKNLDCLFKLSVHFNRFQPEICFLGKFGPKKWNEAWLLVINLYMRIVSQVVKRLKT